LPIALQKRPELSKRIEPYIQAYLTLGSFRNELGRIEFRDIVLYAEKVDEEEVLDFVSIIACAERAYITAIKEKSESKVGKG